MSTSHALSRAEFDAIAAGEPDAVVVSKLLTGMHSKRIVMLRAILELAAQRCAEARPALEAGYELLARAQGEDRAAVRTVLTHPSVGAWAARCLRRLQNPAEPGVPLATELGHLAAVAAAAAIRAEQPFELDVPLRDGTVMLPTLGLASFYGMTAPAVTVSSDGSRVTLTAESHVVTIPADPEQDAEGWLGLRRLRSQAAGASIAFDLDDVDPARHSDGNALCTRLDRAGLAAWQSSLDEAWAILAAQYPGRAAALAAGVRCVVPLRLKANGDGTGVTLGDAFGGISMTMPPDALRLADSLIHEFHHSVLYAVATLVRLHEAGPGAEHYSPWRDDPRPVDGVLHGAYAYLGVVDFWRGQRGSLSGQDLRYADFEFARWRREVAQAADGLLGSPVLTAAGRVFVQGMAGTAGRWLDMPVDEEAQQLADRMASDHRLRWQLRNRKPDPAAIAAIANAWLAADLCPADPRTVVSTVVPSPRRLTLGDRGRLYGLRLRHPEAVGQAQASAADIAYVQDDYARALELYQAAITADPGDAETWAGLVLTLTALDAAAGLTVAPEVARGVYLDAVSRGGAVDVTALGSWLARATAGAGQDLAAAGAR
jgi:HEXXH motif-containing protein